MKLRACQGSGNFSSESGSVAWHTSFNYETPRGDEGKAAADGIMHGEVYI